MTVVIGKGVYCQNPECPHVKKRKEQRYIGVDGGGGGRWQCANCNQWTERPIST